MRVLTLSAYDDVGGAARAAYRLNRGLNSIGVEATMLVRHQQRDDPRVNTVAQVGGQIGQQQSRLAYLLDRRPLSLYRHKRKDRYFSLNWLPSGIARQVHTLDPDIVHLHWVGQGFVPVGALRRFQQPIVWTLHDSWAFTGGCYLPYGCTRFEGRCGRCPHLGSSRDLDASRWTWERKHSQWRDLDLTIVTPSRWLADCSKRSSLFQDVPVEVIPHGLNVAIYSPADQAAARAVLNLPQDKRLILFGAVSSTSDPNKGFHLLQPALRRLAEQGWGDKAEAVVFGSDPAQQSEDLGLSGHYLGYIGDETTMAALYAAADVVVTPSLQEAFGLVVMEAMACGTPCVGFRIGGISDLIVHQVNGYLAEPYEVEDLARGIAWVLEDDQRRHELGARGAAKIKQEYSLAIMAQRDVALYEGILARHGDSA